LISSCDPESGDQPRRDSDEERDATSIVVADSPSGEELEEAEDDPSGQEQDQGDNL
jgi:hypothetical protein